MINTYPLVRPLLFSLDPEEAHDFSFAQLDRLERCGLLKALIGKPLIKPVELCGLRFRNPVGLAAGLDKDGKHIDALASLGFGFLEIGTVTPLPQPGNPKPRMFRLPSAHALINRMGFNNDGVDACIERVKRSRFYQEGGVIGLNIGKNASTPIENAANDYVIGMRKVYRVASYITANISSPNTKNLRDLQGEAMLRQLLQALHQTREDLSNQLGVRKPLFLKIAPDLELADLELIADLLIEFGIDAVIATNTTMLEPLNARASMVMKLAASQGHRSWPARIKLFMIYFRSCTTAFPSLGLVASCLVRTSNRSWMRALVWCKSILD